MRISTEIGWGDKPGGGRRVAINTLSAMADLRPDYDFLVYSSCHHPALDKPNIYQKLLQPPAIVPKLVWDQLLFPHLAVPLQLARDEHSVAHFTHNYVSAWGGQPAVTTIHDMTPFVIPESYGKAHAAYQRATFHIAARRAKHIITVSEHSKQDICTILDVPQDRVTVVHLASGLRDYFNCPQFEAANLKADFGVTHPFILYVGAIHPRKNVARLIKAYIRLRADNSIFHQLVIAGAFRWMAEDILAASETKVLEEDDIIFTGRVDERQLVTLFRQASVFAYPSIYEGFGLPVLEAMSLGTPVVTSNTTSLPEVAGDAAVLVDPLSVDSIAAGIEEITSSDTRAAELRKKGLKRATEFSWQRTGKKMLEVLECASTAFRR